MYDSDLLKKADFKQLRESVIEIYDKYEKLKRTLDDAINNIDEGNLATTIRKKLDGYESKFTVAANKIESMVSHEELEEGLKQYSTITQTADQIKMAVSETRQYTDGQTRELSAAFTISAGAIESRVTKVNNGLTTAFSQIEQTADSIHTLVHKEYSLSNAQNYNPNNPPAQVDTERLIHYGSKYYYYNKIAGKWLEYQNGVEAALTQTSDGFVFHGFVDIDKSVFVGDSLQFKGANDSNKAEIRIFDDSQEFAMVGYNGRAVRLECRSGNSNNHLVIDGSGLEYNDKRVLTTDDLPSMQGGE